MLSSDLARQNAVERPERVTAAMVASAHMYELENGRRWRGGSFLPVHSWWRMYRLFKQEGKGFARVVKVYTKLESNGKSEKEEVWRDRNEEQERRDRLKGRVVAFTTPAQYAARLATLLEHEGACPLWCPTIVTETTDSSRQEVGAQIFGEGREPASCFKGLDDFKGIAFTSRAGIQAFSEALRGRHPSLREEGEPFLVAALGRDAELLQELDLFQGNGRVKTVVPSTATPQALIEELGEGRGRRLLCPVPRVVGLEEPPVVPDFLEGLKKKGWDPVRLNAYVTRWAGRNCAQRLVQNVIPDTNLRQLLSSIDLTVPSENASCRSVLLSDRNRSSCPLGVDALVFTSTAEIEGLINSLNALGLGVDFLRKGGGQLVLAAHGPVTAAGAARLGVQIDIVGKEFNSFAGVVDSLAKYFAAQL